LISGADVFSDLRAANGWIEDYLPNSNAYQSIRLNEKPSMFRKILEILPGGKLGDRFEAWEMHRKITKFSKQQGFGIETNFNADVCQGNFDHHGMWTLQRYEERLRKLDLLK
jgi:hypothetical protein